jgi:2-dehydro-3-deoxyphosphogluconate aldolase/(4S)-4-hydroxy-2-oxoglutarate aldolase
VINAISEQGVLGIVRSASGQEARDIAGRLWQAGLRAVEISVSTPGALDAVAELVAARSDPALVIGAGTIIDADTARSALSAGADLLVSPLADPDVIAVGRDVGAAVLAGAATPAEAVAAMRAGASLVKLFPARMLSPAIVADILQALPELPLMPTGGVAIADVGAWIGAGAIAVGLGGALTAGTPAEIPARVHRVLAAVSGGSG